MATCELPGAALIGLAFFLEDRYSWQGISQATFVGIGTALLLAGVVFFFEHRFLRDVGEVAAEAGSEAARVQVAQATEDINVRLGQLSDQMNDLLSEQAAVHDEAVAALDTPTFDTVATALAHANALGALKNGHITVQASDDPDELGLEFSWGVDMGDGRFGQPTRITLKVHAIVYADFHLTGGGGRPFIEIEWASDESAAAAGLRIRAQLTSRGRLAGEGTFRWERALGNLQRALNLAIRSRRRDPGAVHLHGALAELVNDEWMITEAGLECPGHDGYVFAHDLFPSRLQHMTHKARDEWMPDRPDWVEQALWARLIERGKRILPIERGPVTMTPSWVPCNHTPDDLRRAASTGA